MTSDEIAVAVIDAFSDLDIRYMLVGSLAGAFYAVPRSTQDADFVVQMDAAALELLKRRLCPPFRFDPQMTFETATATVRRVLHLPDNLFTVELFHLSDDAYDRERFARRRRETLFSRGVFISSAEDVIVTKLRWSLAARRPKDKIDAANVIGTQGERLDWDYIIRWCDRLGTRALLDEIRETLKTQLSNDSSEPTP
jgi:hypothetical protein